MILREGLKGYDNEDIVMETMIMMLIMIMTKIMIL